MYPFSTFIFALAAATVVLASPAPVVKRAPQPKIVYLSDLIHPTSAASPAKRAITECQAVNAVVGALKAVSKVAYPFCSTYINIPVVTSTNTITTTVTPSPVSVTATVTPPAETTVTTTTFTSTVVTGTTTVYSRYTPTVAKEKRAAPTLPPYVSAFAASQVSKACSCLSIPARTTTATTTVGTTLPANTITATVTGVTETITVTATATTTTTAPAVTSTVPALCAPSVLGMTSGVLGTNGNDFPNSPTVSFAGDITSCCTACFNTRGCLSYFINQGQCTVFTSVDQASPNTANLAQQALCPLGLNQNDSIFPDGVSAPASGDSAFHIGPCVRDATPLI